MSSFRVAFALLLTSFQVGNAQYAACDKKYIITAPGGSVSVTHSQSTGQCRYLIAAPADTFIQASCSVTMKAQMSCANRAFWVSRSGDMNLQDGASYCNSGSVTSTSIGNEIVIVYSTNTANSGSFQCTFTSVALTNTNCDCGWNPNTKIVGGTTTAVNEFVSMVGIVHTPSSLLFCGGTIISQNYVLSAAHCFVTYFVPLTLGLLVGDHDITIGSDSPWSALYGVLLIQRHPLYNPTTYAHDIALLRTTNYIKFNLGVGPACLPYTLINYPFTGENLTVVGWGTTSFGGPSSNVLRKAPVEVITNILCAQNWPNIDSTKICTDGKLIRGACTYDSGGGLYYYSNNRYYAIGISSYGSGCASAIPSVNIRIGAYTPFIQASTGAFFCLK